ncbi:hypothetical protein Q9R08_05265 [Microbacterium sp. QXD-8]|uniref:Exo-alpha-sialidase n=1 Tax=Microbacterium psychrotolerans TaxID=3068321 RepID=A0ABU0Z037_9MICO|nr:hypothetical protein [Microbacterium sp. QXD-8]MDQ7877383.1 hypothetical protein [Microbacterium sp. QXD-8]
MAVQDRFDTPIAYNPDGNGGEGELVPNAVFEVYAVDDVSFTTPLAVFEPASGAAIPTLRSSSIGVLPQFAVAGSPSEVVLKSGSFATRLQSRFGVLTEAGFDPEAVAVAVAAAPTAVAARDAALAAQAAAEAVPVSNDGIVKALVEDTDSETAAALSAKIAGAIEVELPEAGAPLFDPLNEARRLFQDRARFDLEQFAKRATAAWSDGNSWFVQGITKDRTRLIATKTDDVAGLAIGHSDDDGLTWTLDENLPVANAKRIGDLVVLDNGEIVVCALNAAPSGPYRSYIYKSSGFAANPATATFSLVFSTPFAQQNTSPTSQYRGFAYDGAARIMGVWYDKKTDNSGGVPNDAGVRARLSTDRGDTWTEVFNLHTFLTALGVNTLASGYHVHSCAYDPIWDAWWISYGDFTGSAGESGIVYSLDNGATWEIAYRGTGPWQSVSIYPMLDYILLMGDGGASSGVNRIARGDSRGEIGALSKGYAPPFMTAIGHKGQDALAPGHWVLLTMSQITGTDRLSRLMATADGKKFFELYVDSTYTVSGVSGFRYVVGPTASGKLVATSVSDGRYAGTSSLLTVQVP